MAVHLITAQNRRVVPVKDDHRPGIVRKENFVFLFLDLHGEVRVTLHGLRYRFLQNRSIHHVLGLDRHTEGVGVQHRGFVYGAHLGI